MGKLIKKIAHYYGLSYTEMSQLIQSAPHRYKVFEIPKRNSEKMRLVAQPAREVKVIQRWLLEEVLNDLPIHASATAYRRGLGIGENARRHASCRYLLKMDFENYFPSIKNADVAVHLKTFIGAEYDDEDISHICRLVLWKPKRAHGLELCIGGPSSPLISNSIAFEFDELVQEHCVSKGVIYTRYADDLAFSTDEPDILRGIEMQIKEICGTVRYPNLKINDRKTVHTSTKHRRFVTGVVLTPDGNCSLGRQRKRMIRSAIYRAIKGLLSNEEMSHLRGLLAFANDIEPSFVESMIKKYTQPEIEKIFKWSQPD